MLLRSGLARYKALFFLDEGAAMCVLSRFALFSVPGKGECECSAVPEALLLKKTNRHSRDFEADNSGAEIFSPAELSTCVLTACRQWALWQRLCSKLAPRELLPPLDKAGE